MERKIIHIDEKKCNGCGACATACHEGAIAMLNGKAKLIRDDYCDGLGDCLPACPTNAISFVVREAVAYNEEAVLANKALKEQNPAIGKAGKILTCPGMKSEIFAKPEVNDQENLIEEQSMLSHWPVQLKLVIPNGAYFENCDLLIAADCSAYAYAGFHQKFIKGHTTIVGCPKLDNIDYSEKLTEIFSINDIKSITLVRMQVPCCGGLEMATKKALEASKKSIPLNVVTLTAKGKILSEVSY